MAVPCCGHGLITSDRQAARVKNQPPTAAVNGSNVEIFKLLNVWLHRHQTTGYQKDAELQYRAGLTTSPGLADKKRAH